MEDDTNLQKVTETIALRVIRVCEALPEEWHARALGRELLHCGTAIGARCRAVLRAKTPAARLARLEDVEDMADDTLYWLSLISGAGVVPTSRLRSLVAEVEKFEQEVAAMIANQRPRRAAPRPKVQEAA
jgi:four helix bundle protein